MICPTQQKREQISRILLMLTIGLAAWSASPENSWALKPRPTIYNECACRCVAPGDIVGSISHFNNDAGVSCGAYLGKTCNYTNSTTGGVSTGTLKNCGGYKPGGTKALQAAPQVNAPIMRRGVDGESSTSSPTVPAEAGK